MRNQDRIEFLPGSQRRTIQRLGFLPALEHAALHENPGIFGLDYVPRTGNLSPRRADTSDFHSTPFMPKIGYG
jgi:hypothetical protein